MSDIWAAIYYLFCTVAWQLLKYELSDFSICTGAKPKSLRGRGGGGGRRANISLFIALQLTNYAPNSSSGEKFSLTILHIRHSTVICSENEFRIFEHVLFVSVICTVLSTCLVYWPVYSSVTCSLTVYLSLCHSCRSNPQLSCTLSCPACYRDCITGFLTTILFHD